MYLGLHFTPLRNQAMYFEDRTEAASREQAAA